MRLVMFMHREPLAVARIVLELAAIAVLAVLVLSVIFVIAMGCYSLLVTAP
jgi:hypothetical protein